LSLVPAGVAYAWAQHILATDPEIRRMVEASGARGGEARRCDDTRATTSGGDETRADALDDVRRRLARLETALAATKSRRDGDDEAFGKTPRVSPRASASPRTTGDANRREPPRTRENKTSDSDTPEPPPSRWRRAWRRARRFSKRLIRDDAFSSEGE
jgi:hypothetical protein